MPIPARCLAAAGVLVLSLACVRARAEEPAEAHRMMSGTVLRVFDGDTLEVQVGKRKLRVHVNGVDAPESNQPWGKEATQALAQLVMGQTVDIEPVGKASGSRITAMVYAGESEVGSAMVGAGNAWAARRELRPSDVGLCEAEQAAREERRGLWSLPPPKRIAPWLFRLHFPGSMQPQRGTESLEECKAAALRQRAGKRPPAPATPVPPPATPAAG